MSTKSLDIRQSLTCFPTCTQPFWTWLTGMALTGQKRVLHVGPWVYLATTYLAFALGFTITTYATLSSVVYTPLWLIGGWMLTIHGARKMALVIAHQCGHYRFIGSPRLDRLVGEITTTLILSQDNYSYRQDHVEGHHGNRTFGSGDDPVLSFILRFGYRPGMSRKMLWALTLFTLVSPHFHGFYLYSRLRSNLVRAQGLRRLAAWCHVMLWMLLILFVPDMGRVFLISYAIPVVFVYHQSAFLELLTEHAWFRPRQPGESPRDYIANRCWGRFCASPLPDPDRPLPVRLAGWMWWVLVMTLYHFPMRFLVLAGDAPQHDFHHRHPGSRDWANAEYARQDDVAAGHPSWPAYIDVWGFHVALNQVFDALGSVDADQFERLVLAPATRYVEATSEA